MEIVTTYFHSFAVFMYVSDLFDRERNKFFGSHFYFNIFSELLDDSLNHFRGNPIKEIKA